MWGADVVPLCHPMTCFIVFNRLTMSEPEIRRRTCDTAPANRLGIRHSAVEVRAVADSYRFCAVRGSKGLIVALEPTFRVQS